MKKIILKDRDSRFVKSLVRTNNDDQYEYYLDDTFCGYWFLIEHNRKGLRFQAWVMGQPVQFFINYTMITIEE